jgi:hypothetical protein
MREAIDNFTEQITLNDLLVSFHFARYGLQWNDQNYSMSIDTNRISQYMSAPGDAADDVPSDGALHIISGDFDTAMYCSILST